MCFAQQFHFSELFNGLMGNIDSILFRPPPVTPLSPSIRFFLTTEYGNKIPACFFRRVGASITILYSHGNAEDLGLIINHLMILSRKLNVNILAYDYTGYGEAAGYPSEDNCYADIEAAYHHLVSHRKINPRQIVLYGRSVGSGPSTYIAAKLANIGEQIGGLILECPFKSVISVVADFGCSSIIGDKFPNIVRISSVRAPVMIIHGTEDNTVPISHGEHLYESIEDCYKAKPYWVLGKGHNDLDYSSDPLIQRLHDYLRNYLGDYFVPSSCQQGTSKARFLESSRNVRYHSRYQHDDTRNRIYIK